MNNLSKHATNASWAARPIKLAGRVGSSVLNLRHTSTDSGSSSSKGIASNKSKHAEPSSLPPLPQPPANARNLMEPDILMDLHESVTFEPSRFTPFRNKVIVRNDPSMFEALRRHQQESGDPAYQDEQQQQQRAQEEAQGPLNFLALTTGEINRLYRYPIIRRRVVQQTGKGKIARQHVVMVVGNQNGLVGIGEGKADEAQRATRAALAAAVRSMDYIERFEDRTVWTEMETKFASTRIILRPRPVGFGLHCNPNIYHILKAAGIKDISAKVWGSRNPLQVIRALMRMLMPGYAPQGMGNGIGGKGRRLDKGAGLRAQDELERERGRKLVPLRL